MNDLPEPLVPADCDLRGMEWMPVDITRLFDSDLYALSTGDEFKAAFTLWGKSFFQVPAASLPDNERVLAHLSGAGARWEKVRKMVLHGWVKCSDGRLYHPVVAEKALESWERRKRERERKAAWRDSRGGGGTQGRDAERTRNGRGRDADVPRDRTGTVAGQDGDATGTERGRDSPVPSEQKGQERKGKEVSIPKASLSAVPAIAAPASSEPFDARRTLWDEGVAAIQRLTGKPAGPTKSLVGRLLREAHDDCAGLLQAIQDCPPSGDPVAWLMAAARARGTPRLGTIDQIRSDWNLPSMFPEAEAVVEDVLAERRRLQ